MTAAEIMREAESLPVEQRALLVEQLLRTLNTPDPDMDRVWASVARRRLEELRAGLVKSVPGEHVFEAIRNRFS